MATFTIYRKTTIGETLQDSLNELKYEIKEDLALKVMEKFDEVICAKFREFNHNSKLTLKGKCRSYNNCDNVWLFRMESCSIKGDSV